MTKPLHWQDWIAQQHIQKHYVVYTNYDSETEKHFNFLTNNFVCSAQTIADLYRYRWQIELFFKWIKQHLRIKSFYGTSENAIKTQIWIAVSIYVLVAIIKKRLKIDTSLYNILQVLSLTLFEKKSLIQLLDNQIIIRSSLKMLSNWIYLIT